ncbi:MAG: hypothetical protein JJE04_05800 [Acidobacteriia bacterium]|nr:hypothetical protein [Terriglobia bacterium]
MPGRKRTRKRAPSGFFRFESAHSQTVTGFGDGDVVRLRNENGTTWVGQSEMQDDDTVRYRFSDSDGNSISGISDRLGILLRDQKGRTWRGVVI